VKRLLLGAGGWILLVLAGLELVYLIGETFLRPPLFKASAFVGFDDRRASRDSRLTGGDIAFASSTNVLYPVCQSLELGEKWGKKFNVGTLPDHETYRFLWVKLVAHRSKDGRGAELSIFSDDTNEPAILANAVAASLTNHWAQRNKIMADEVRIQNATGIQRMNRWSLTFFEILKYALPCGSIGIGLVFFSRRFPPILPIPQKGTPRMSKY